VKDDFFGESDIARLQRSWTSEQTQAYLRDLPIWMGPIALEQKAGGLTNRTYFATDADARRYAVRCGFDRYRERQPSVVHCTKAAHKLGLGPALRYWEPNITITDFIEGPRMTEEQFQEPAMIAHIVERLKALHQGSHAVEETISYWWVFDTVRRYLNQMETGYQRNGFKPSALAGEAPFFRQVSDTLEAVMRPFVPVLTHNCLGYVNLMFDAEGRVLFIDWDGGGYGNPIFDLATLCMWLDADEERDRYVLGCYFDEADEAETNALLRELRACKTMEGVRLITETSVALLDPFYYLQPDEVARSMAEYFPDGQAGYEGLIDIIRPMFENSWDVFCKAYG
jgi:thiamine kinase-like enzyme